MEMNEKCTAGLKNGKYRQQVCFDLVDLVVAGSSAGGAHKVLMYDIRRYVPGAHVFPPKHQVRISQHKLLIKTIFFKNN